MKVELRGGEVGCHAEDYCVDRYDADYCDVGHCGGDGFDPAGCIVDCSLAGGVAADLAGGLAGMHFGRTAADFPNCVGVAGKVCYSHPRPAFVAYVLGYTHRWHL